MSRFDLAPSLGKGARFKCIVPDRCDGHCCKGEGCIYIFPEDIERFLRSFNISLERFIDEYTKIEEESCTHEDMDKWVPFITLVEQEDGTCLFLDERGLCTVYSARPSQCRTFPFWKMNCDTDRRWERLVKFCPGAAPGPAGGADDDDAREYDVDTIRALVEKEQGDEQAWEKAMLEWKNDYMGFLKHFLARKSHTANDDSSPTLRCEEDV